MEQNKWMWLSGVLIVGLIIGYSLKGTTAVAPSAQDNQPSPVSQTTDKPSEGFTLHIDAEKHFPADMKKIAHHYCKQVKSGMTECQLYDSDDKDAKLAGVEVVVSTDTWKGFNKAEQKYWHYHKEEIPKVNAKLPDLSEEEAAKVVETLTETYGKIYLLWDPAKTDQPVGQPSINIID